MPMRSRPAASRARRLLAEFARRARDAGQALAGRVVTGPVLRGPFPRLVVPLDHPAVVRPPPGPHAFAAIEALFEAHRPAIEAALAALEPHLFAPGLRAVPAQAADGTGPYWNNGYFSGADARLAYAFVQWLRPRRIVEIGSGSSTRFFRKAIADAGSATELTCIDPAPRAEIQGIADRVLRRSVLEVELDLFRGLEPGDILFLDGSHLCFSGTDTVRFFLEILPEVRAGVVVHVHDVCLPLDYIEPFRERGYGEQYVLAASLLGARTLEPLVPVAWLEAQGRLGGEGGVSFWARRL